MTTFPQLFPARHADEARAWIAECDLDPEDSVALPGGQALAGVERHYEGGLTQFVTDGE